MRVETLGAEAASSSLRFCERSSWNRLLLEFQGEVVSRDRFLDEVWGYHASPTSRTVDNFIAELRKKLGNEGSEIIQSVRGKGYRLVE